MKIAHLILAHNNPEQLERLMKRLVFQDDALFIHLDKKAQFTDFEHLRAYPNVYFIKKRVHVGWGSYSMIEATLNGFQEIAKANTYDYVNLLSGSDYPLQTPAQVHQFLLTNNGTAFMHFLPMETEWQEALPRITKYHLTNYQFPGSYKLEWLINKLAPVRRLPHDLVPVGRSQWFTIPVECMNYILQYWHQHPELERFLKFTWGPDEFVFQTILYNSAYRDQMVNNNLRLIDWSNGGVSPKTFMDEDKSQVLSSEQLYARKFDLTKSPEILNLIDEKLAALAQADQVC